MKYLITSALPYINGVKHLGNIIGSLLPADVYSRFLRQQELEVLFICGTDEHGTPAEIAAKEEGLEVAAYCEKMYLKQKDIYEKFAIDFDYFGRSSSASNHNITREIFNSLDKNGFIIEESIQQFYSIDDQRYLPDRYVTGTCPHCKYDKARGDQCDLCGKLLDPLDLINPKSAISGSSNLEAKTVSHLFLALDKLEEKVRTWLHEKESGWPVYSVSVAKKWLNEGLQPRCISRDLDWGISIPKPGYEEKVFYVWFDAPMAYIAITQDWARDVAKNNDAWKKWWCEDLTNTQYAQFMAKDNLPFHGVMWPAMLLGADANKWKTVDCLKGFHWLTYEGGKFSTSLKRGIFSDIAIELFPADYWRYYLLANIPESNDSDFRLDDFVTTINKDLVGVLGNFVNRVAALLEKYFEGQVPDYDINNEHVKKLVEHCLPFAKNIEEDYFSLNFRSLMRNLRELWCFGNEFITVAEPWKLIKSDKKEAGDVLAACLHLIRLYAIASYPVIPISAMKMLNYLPLSEDSSKEKFKLAESVVFDYLKPGEKLGNIELLFEKITPEKHQELQQTFSNIS